MDTNGKTALITGITGQQYFSVTAITGQKTVPFLQSYYWKRATKFTEWLED